MKNVASQNATSKEMADYRIQILKKYPNKPNEGTIEFIENVMSYPGNELKADRITLEERKKYKKE